MDDSDLIHRCYINPSGSHILNILFLYFLLEKQLSNVDESTMPKIYFKCGYNVKIKKEILAGQVEILQVNSIHSTSCQHQVSYMYWRIGELKVIRLENSRITYALNVPSVGVYFPLLEHLEVKILYLKINVFPSIYTQFVDIDGKIHLDNTMIWPRLRERDICFMDVELKMKLAENLLGEINGVREWYNVKYLSEVCTIGGFLFMKVGLQMELMIRNNAWD